MKPGPKPMKFPREAFEGRTVAEAAEALGVSIDTVRRHRRAHGITGNTKSDKRLRPIPDDLRERWVELYKQGLSVQVIKKRYSGWSIKTIRLVIREDMGVDQLAPARRFDPGWCAT